MYGNLGRPQPLKDIKPQDMRGGLVEFTVPKFKKRGFLEFRMRKSATVVLRPEHRESIGYGAWKDHAGKTLSTAALKGRLTVYAFASAPDMASDSDISKPVVIPRDVLRRMVLRRGCLPDRAIQPSHKMTNYNNALLKLLSQGVLLVCAQEFNEWYRGERNKGTWASQGKRKRPRCGRPVKLTNYLETVITNLMQATQKQATQMSVAALHRQLIVKGCTYVPSQDTLARILDQLHRKTGDPSLRRNKRSRPKEILKRCVPAKPPVSS